MMKYALLAATCAFATPALAQTQATPAPSSSGEIVTSPQTGPQSAPQTTAPADDTAATAATAAPAEAAQPAAAGATQVAQVVDSEFPTYDADKNGSLDAKEFAGWMVKLKSVSDPATKADDPATKQWVAAAFKQADADKSRSLTKTELTGFLSKGQSGA
jgi:hypothetical protein